MSKGLFANTGKALNKDNIELYTPKFVVDKIIPIPLIINMSISVFRL